MKKPVLCALCLCAASIAHSGTVIKSANTVTVDTYPDPTYLTTFSNSGATFTGTGNTTTFEISAFGKDWGTKDKEILCPRTATINCGGDFNVTFGAAVNELQFYLTGDDATTTALSVEAFLNGASLGTHLFYGDGNPFSANLVDLSGFGDVDEIKVTGAAADANGLGYADFSFLPAVPEASTWAMMLIGFAAIGAAVRRRQKPSAVLGA